MSPVAIGVRTLPRAAYCTVFEARTTRLRSSVLSPLASTDSQTEATLPPDSNRLTSRYGRNALAQLLGLPALAASPVLPCAAQCNSQDRRCSAAQYFVSMSRLAQALYPRGGHWLEHNIPLRLLLYGKSNLVVPPFHNDGGPLLSSLSSTFSSEMPVLVLNVSIHPRVKNCLKLLTFLSTSKFKAWESPRMATSA